MRRCRLRFDTVKMRQIVKPFGVFFCGPVFGLINDDSFFHSRFLSVKLTSFVSFLLSPAVVSPECHAMRAFCQLPVLKTPERQIPAEYRFHLLIFPASLQRK